MRVLHILKVKGIAGAEQHLLTLLPGLRVRGVDARFLILVPPDNPAADFTAAAEARGIPLEKLVIRHHADVTLYGQLLSKIREFSPDVVHTHLQHGDLYGIPAARWAGVPVVITSRHNDDGRRRNRVLRWLNRWLWGQVNAGIAISESVRQFSMEVEHVPAQKIITIHYGISSGQVLSKSPQSYAALRSELGLSEQAILMGTVCRLLDWKGVQYAIEAFSQVQTQFPDAHLVITGDGPMRQSLQTQVHKLHLMNRVHFRGWRSDVGTVMSGLDIFLMPSEREGFGLVLLEAMSYGLPVIGSQAGAIPEVVVDGETGIIVAPKKSDEIAEALRWLLADRSLRQYMGLQGQDRLEVHFSAARMIDQTLSLYQHLLTQQAG